MKRLIYTLALMLCAVTVHGAVSQVPATTAYSRDFLTANNASNALSKLGITVVDTNGVAVDVSKFFYNTGGVLNGSIKFSGLNSGFVLPTNSTINKGSIFLILNTNRAFGIEIAVFDGNDDSAHVLWREDWEDDMYTITNNTLPSIYVNKSVFSMFTNTVLSVNCIPDDGIDDSTEINSALTNGGFVVISRPGIYQITNTLIIPSNTRFMLHPGATIRRMANINAMLLNGSDGTVGGYGASSNITVEGGTWDANGATWTGQCTILAFSHASGLVVRDLTVMNEPVWHGLELNSIRRAVVQNVLFQNCTNEALQIDYNTTANFPWFGPEDYSACSDILIQSCTFRDSYIGIGSHSTRVGTTHQNIRIRDCTFTNLTGHCVKPLDYSDLTVSGCSAEFVRGLISIGEFQPANSNYVVNVSGNTVRNSTNGNPWHCIYLRYVNNVNIFDNSISNCSYQAVSIDGLVKNIQVNNNTIYRPGWHTSVGSGISALVGEKNLSVIGNKIADAFTLGISIGDGGPVTNAVVIGNITTNGIYFSNVTNLEQANNIGTVSNATGVLPNISTVNDLKFGTNSVLIVLTNRTSCLYGSNIVFMTKTNAAIPGTTNEYVLDCAFYSHFIQGTGAVKIVHLTNMPVAMGEFSLSLEIGTNGVPHPVSWPAAPEWKSPGPEANGFIQTNYVEATIKVTRLLTNFSAVHTR